MSKPSSGDTDDWVVAETWTDEQLLTEAWTHLPFDLPYEEFRTHMLTLKRRQQRSRLTNATLWTLETMWWLSGYASSVMNAVQYRNLIVPLLLWLAQP